MVLAMSQNRKRKPVTLQTEQMNVADPAAVMQQTQKAPMQAVPKAPSPPKEAAPPPKVAGGFSGGGAQMAGGFGAGGSGGAIKLPTMTGAADLTTPPTSATTQRAEERGTKVKSRSLDVTGPGSRTEDLDNDGIPDSKEAQPIPESGSDEEWDWVSDAINAAANGGVIRADSRYGGGPGRTSTGGPPPPSNEESMREVGLGGPLTDDEFDQQVRKLMGDLLSGRGMDVSTAEEEKLIQELMQDRLGQQLVEQRARMGRAGFGASGALAAMESDAQRAAAQQATRETLAVRRQSEQEAIDNALRAIGVDVEKRTAGSQSVMDQIFMQALASELGLELPTEEGGGEEQWGAGDTELANAQSDTAVDQRGTAGNPIVVSSPPPGTARAGSDVDGNPRYWSESERKWYVVRS